VAFTFFVGPRVIIRVADDGWHIADCLEHDRLRRDRFGDVSIDRAAEPRDRFAMKGLAGR